MCADCIVKYAARPWLHRRPTKVFLRRNAHLPHSQPQCHWSMEFDPVKLAPLKMTTS